MTFNAVLFIIGTPDIINILHKCTSRLDFRVEESVYLTSHAIRFRGPLPTF